MRDDGDDDVGEGGNRGSRGRESGVVLIDVWGMRWSACAA